jgi:hypothetical protein
MALTTIPSGMISSVSASTLSGQVPDANAPSGSVIQVVTNNYSTAFSTASTTFVATGLSASITPSSTSSRIVILAQYQVGANSSHWVYTAVFRNGTNFSTGSGNPVGNYNNNATDYHIPTYLGMVDSPITTSAVTYALYTRTTNAGNTARVHVDNMPSTIILMEIAA